MSVFPVVMAARNRDAQIRGKSSSGGIFYLLAEYVISQDGVVFGARYDETWQVIHDYAENMEQVQLFLGSKYVQSDMGTCYRKAREFLELGRKVLFSGTPCQIYGLKSFLSKQYENLMTVDIICHGVPSRSVWREYLKRCASGRKITNVNFREKTEGWLLFSLKVFFADGTVYRKNQTEDLYMKGFLQDIYLRPSCYECRFKGLKRESDITLADLWGCQNILPDMFDDRGTSLVLIQSELGMHVWEAVNQHIDSCRIETEDYQQYNPNMMISAVKSDKRRLFYQKGLGSIEKLTKPPFRLHRRILGKIKKLVKKMFKKSE